MLGASMAQFWHIDVVSKLRQMTRGLMMLRWTAGALVACLATTTFAAGLPATLLSPDESIRVEVAQDDSGVLTYAITRGGETVFAPSALRLRLAEGDVSYVEVRGTETRSVDTVQKLTATKAAEARIR